MFGKLEPAKPAGKKEAGVIRAIHAPDDGGNILVDRIRDAEAQLRIKPDHKGGWAQWFHFTVDAEPGTTCTLRIVNAGDCSYPEGWSGYQACVFSEGEWIRTATRYEDGVLTIQHRVSAANTAFAYFAPYPFDRHRAQLRRIAETFEVDPLGRSIDGRSIDRIRAGDGPVSVWIIGRQHSGETMASWWMEGALERLTDASPLLRGATVHIVPLANPDGAVRGHLRGNAAGCDLNRQWHKPRSAEAPEVACILSAMSRTGVDILLDVHGDETIPHVFIDGCESVPGVTAYQLAGLDLFKQLLGERSAAFQTAIGYPATYGGPDAGGMCARAIAERFGAIGMTLEMPFWLSLETPDLKRGWSPSHSMQLGRNCIDALAALIEHRQMSTALRDRSRMPATPLA